MATKKFAYIKREWKNGRWQYTYPDDIKAKKNVLTGQVKSKGYGSLDTQKHAMKQIERDVERNSSSRNIPSSETSSGKQMSKLQVEKAKMHGKAVKIMSAIYGQKKAAQFYDSHGSLGKNIAKSIASENFHIDKLREVNRDKPSYETPANETVKQTTKKQIRQGIRKAKIKTLKREAAAAIKRAQDWIKDLFG